MKHIKYPKLLLLAESFILSYLLYQIGVFDILPKVLHGHGYISMFLGGLLFSFGFTTPFAIAVFVEMADLVHPVLGALVAACGALIADLTIFQFIRCSFEDELRQMKRATWARYLRDKLHHETVPERVRQYVLWSVAGVIIASPFPDEVAVSLLSGFTEVRRKPFAFVAFTLNAVGVVIILIASQAAMA